MYILYEYPYKLNLYNGEIVSEEYLYWSNYFRANNFPDISASSLLLITDQKNYHIISKYDIRNQKISYHVKSDI